MSEEADKVMAEAMRRAHAALVESFDRPMPHDGDEIWVPEILRWCRLEGDELVVLLDHREPPSGSLLETHVRRKGGGHG